MAWTLHILVGVAVITASAFKCKHSSNSNSDHDPRYHYDFGNLPNVRPYDRMNTRSAEISSQSNSQLRLAESTSQSENRRGQSNDNNKIVFPGPTSEPFKLELPDHCKKLGICEDVGNYPQEEVNKVIATLGDLDTFQNDKLDLPDVPDITQRLGPLDDNMELCSFQEKVVYPKAAIDPNGKWHVVLNTDANPLQGFKVEICDVDSSPCSDFARFQDGYKGRCKQKYVYRKMAVLQNGTKLERSLKVPSCCSCVAKLVLQ